MEQQLQGGQTSITEDNIKDVIRTRFDVTGKPAQVDTLFHLLSKEQDAILVAKTGFGKSMLF